MLMRQSSLAGFAALLLLYLLHLLLLLFLLSLLKNHRPEIEHIWSILWFVQLQQHCELGSGVFWLLWINWRLLFSMQSSKMLTSM